MKDFLKDLYKTLTNRIFITFLVICLLFYFIVARLFDMQVVNSQHYENQIKKTSTIPVRVKAPRGIIVDKYGRPIASNKSVRVVKIDYSMFSNDGKPIIARGDNNANQNKILVDSSDVGDLSTILYKLIKIFEKNNETYKDDFPISKTEPFEYLYDGNKKKEMRFINKELKLGEEYISADEAIKRLREDKTYNIPEEWTNIEARNVLSFLTYYRQNAFMLYSPIIIAQDISDTTAVAIAEYHTFFHGVSVESESVREYPYAESLSNLIGYTGKISQKELDEKESQGYKNNDLIGKTGLEASMEDYLRGKDGKNTIEVTNLNKRVGTIEQIEPQQGNTCVTNIDAELQHKVYKIIQDELKTVILNKLNRVSPFDEYISDVDILNSIAKGNNVNMKKIMESGENSYSHKFREIILSNYPDIDITDPDSVLLARKLFAEALDNEYLTKSDIIMIMREQSIITGDDEYFNSYLIGQISTITVLKDKIENDELTPQILGLDPFSASIVLVNVNTGAIIVSVGYPSYDNNIVLNLDYFNKVNGDNITTPLFNRPFRENIAPGSVFKIITAITGLETGTIDENTYVYDNVTFTDAGFPPSSCWRQAGHGAVNVVTALEVSCNYFFFQTAYNMISGENPFSSIRNMMHYMTEFGLNDKTGVEITESAIANDADIHISSPELKEIRKPDEPWSEGDTIRTAIGQSENAYTAAVMAKYIATVATKGVRHSLHLLDKIITSDGDLVKKQEPVVEKNLEISDHTWDLVFQGLRNVIVGERGTAVSVFKGFNIDVGGKTGTAQQDKSRPDHSTFGGFAPFDKPEVAIYVAVPNGDSKGTPAVASQLARKVFDLYFNTYTEPERPALANTLAE